MCTKISWRKYFLKIFLKEFFSFLLSRKLALLTKNLHATLVKPTLNSRMEIVWQQSFDLFLCNTNNFIFRKFIHWIYFDISRNLHSFVIVSSLLCVVLSEVILQKLYINISTLQWWFQDKIKFILRYLPIEKKFTRQYQNANKKNATPIEKRHAWGVPGVLRETPASAPLVAPRPPSPQPTHYHFPTHVDYSTTTFSNT